MLGAILMTTVSTIHCFVARVEQLKAKINSSLQMLLYIPKAYYYLNLWNGLGKDTRTDRHALTNAFNF
jgi:hypothetical protein